LLFIPLVERDFAFHTVEETVFIFTSSCSHDLFLE
jgi:hypothetical protein